MYQEETTDFIDEIDTDSVKCETPQEKEEK